MEDREFTELELRAMLDAATALQPDPVAGRWRAFTRHRGRRWIVIVEPDISLQALVVVTAFPTRRPR